MDFKARKVETLVADTTAFIQNASLQEVAVKVVTCQEVVDEIVNKRQLKRLVVLPYHLEVKNVFPENIKVITEFARKTGDYPSLSATDIKVMALTYQLEKEKNGIAHIRTEPIMQTGAKVVTQTAPPDMDPDISGFYMPGKEVNRKHQLTDEELEERETIEEIGRLDEDLAKKFSSLDCEQSVGGISTHEDEEDCDLSENNMDVLVPALDSNSPAESASEDDDEDDDSGWITPSNIKHVKKQVNSELMEEKHVAVACMTTDFAMQNVLKQMNLNVSALDGRLIRQLRTFILRCYACFKTTSIMTNQFCPKCGNNTLKKVAVSVDEEGRLQIHINGRKPLTGRGKKFSLPTFKGGKHSNNPIIAPDQPLPDNKPTRLARTKINPLDDDYIAGFSPFAVRDVTSKSAQLGIRPGKDEVRYFMRKNPNEARRKRK